MVIFSDCKINIGLNVVRKREDGYHDIETCMIPVPWHDIIEILPAKSDETTLTVIGNKVDCPPEKNLVMKAYMALKNQYDLPPVDIMLQKTVPDGAGLGGGSSDASHTLKGLNKMLGLGLKDVQLSAIASTIGADCPFFIYDTPMIATGIGEILTPIDLSISGYTILIAKPMGINISTKDAYSGVKPCQPPTPISELLKLPIKDWQGRIVNDFEESVFALAPEIAELKQMMLDSGAIYSSMSGSGASVYGFFESDKMAEKLMSKLGGMPHFMYTVQ